MKFYLAYEIEDGDITLLHMTEDINHPDFGLGLEPEEAAKHEGEPHLKAGEFGMVQVEMPFDELIQIVHDHEHWPHMEKLLKAALDAHPKAEVVA
jgi:hypothetical protein